MSNPESMYFEVTGKNAKKAWQDLKQERYNIADEIKKRYGAKGFIVRLGMTHGFVVGLTFRKGEPPKRIRDKFNFKWRKIPKTDGAWLPEKRTKEGRLAIKDIMRYHPIVAGDVGSTFLGKSITIGANGMMTAPGIRTISNRLFIVASKSKHWKPRQGVKPIKASTYHRIREKAHTKALIS